MGLGNYWKGILGIIGIVGGGSIRWDDGAGQCKCTASLTKTCKSSVVARPSCRETRRIGNPEGLHVDTHASGGAHRKV